MADHTPEPIIRRGQEPNPRPWAVVRDSATRYTIEAETGDGKFPIGSFSKGANAMLAKTCVNACAGLNPEAVGDMYATMNSIAEGLGNYCERLPFIQMTPGEAVQAAKRALAALEGKE